MGGGGYRTRGPADQRTKGLRDKKCPARNHYYCNVKTGDLWAAVTCRGMHQTHDYSLVS